MSIKQLNCSRRFKQSLTRISPKLNTKIIYLVKFKRPINLKNPRTLDEKIQWLKFNTYYNNPLITQCADKYAVREYIKQCGCPEILNELYGVYDKVDEVAWDDFPNKFVIKWNFGCGQNLIVFDKSKLDIEKAKCKLNDWYNLHDTFYLTYSEMQYKGIVPKLICENLIESEHGGLPVDYKFYCFNGVPEVVLVCVGRDSEGENAKYYFFDRNWNLKRYNTAGKEAPEGFTLPKPSNIDKLFDYAEMICKPFPFVRADFYLEYGKCYFGELTFTPLAGFDTNRLPETQLLFGDMVKIDK